MALAIQPLVLLVDDDAAMTRILAKLLREDGYTVETALDGGAAIARLSFDERPAVLVLDFRMPHANGLSVASYARARFPGIPIVMITSWPEMMRDAKLALDPPITIVAKPIQYAELSATLAAVTRPTAT